MNGRERILAAYQGGTPDTVPFAPNIYQWFYYHYRQGTLPAEVADATHPFDVLRYLGADILSRWDTHWATKMVYTDGEYSEEWVGDTGWDRTMVTAFNLYPPRKKEVRKRFETPHGDLTQVWAYEPSAGADFESKYWWTDWDEYEAVRFMVESTEYDFDEAYFNDWVERVGDDGVVMLFLKESPLKALHWLAGPQNATMFMLKHAEEMKGLAKIHEEKVLALLERVIDLPNVEIINAEDNLDVMFYPPYFYTDYCKSFFDRAAEIAHSRGKLFQVHACGRSKKLLPMVGESRIDCLEGITPPSMGDVELPDVRAMVGYKNFTVNGGMDIHRQELRVDAEAQLHAYTSDLFASMGDKRHFVFASSCNTSPLIPWENLVHFRDAAREYGRVD